MSKASPGHDLSFNIFAEHSSDCLCVIDQAGFFKYVNPTMLKLLGKSESELLLAPFFDFIFSEDQANVIQATEKLLITESTSTFFEARLTCEEGSMCWISWTCTASDGDFIYACGQKVNQEPVPANIQIQDSSQLFRETFENAGVGLAHTNYDGFITLVNRELADLLGYSVNEMVGKSYHRFLTSSDVPTPLKQRENLLFGNIDKIVRERPLVKKDGSLVWFLVTATSVRNEHGKVKYFILAHKDISQRKHVELLLRKSEEEFRVLAEAIPQIIWTANSSGEIQYFNEKWYSYTGLSKQETQRTGWRSALHVDDVEKCFSDWKLAIHTGGNYENERRFLRAADGEYRWHLGRAVPIKNSQGEIIKWFGTCTDIHDRKLADREVNLALIGERVAIENERTKSEFLATMSHEIRTPLNSVIGMAEILLDSALDSDQYEYADTIRNSAETLLTLINDVLDFSKIEAGKLAIEKIDFDLKKLLRDLRQEQDWAAATKGISIEMHLDGDLPDWVKGDVVRTRQILSNLLSNAVKFTLSGSVRICARVQNHTENETRIHFEVQDTGIGISAENLSKLFRPFVQVDSSTTREFGGTGLGLSICKNLASMMGGEIRVASVYGKGSTFFVEIPFLRVQKAVGQLQRNRPVVDTEPFSWIRTPKILVAEDLRANQRVIDLFLKKMGCEVCLAENGLQVLEALEREKFDLILMDCQMPTLDGFQATAKIRSDRRQPYCDIPIIATTANAGSKDREICLSSGMTDYLAKPIRHLDLRKTLEMHLKSLVRESSGKVNSLIPLRQTAEASVNWEILQEIDQFQEDDSAASKELVQLFLNNLDDRILQIRKSIDSGHLQNIKRDAHTLKSSSSYVGAVRLQRLCERIREIIDLGGDVSSLKKLMLDIEIELQSVRFLLGQYLMQARRKA